MRISRIPRKFREILSDFTKFAEKTSDSAFEKSRIPQLFPRILRISSNPAGSAFNFHLHARKKIAAIRRLRLVPFSFASSLSHLPLAWKRTLHAEPMWCLCCFRWIQPLFPFSFSCAPPIPDISWNRLTRALALLSAAVDRPKEPGSIVLR
jgi:hypothetical protein